MESSGDTFNINNNVVADSTLLQINRSSSHLLLLLLPWFEVRVFYVRINNISSDDDDDSSPKCLTVNHIPLSPDTLLEVNGVRCGIMYSESVPTFQLIRRKKSVVIADHHHKKKSEEEATFVSTDRIRFTGSIRFEVFNKDELILSGVLEMTTKTKRWNMKCEDHHAGGNGFFFKQHEAASTMEVFVAGSFSDSPVILTKTVRILRNKNNNRKKLLDSIPEFETSYDTTTAHKQDLIHHHHHPLQVVEYGSYNNNNNHKTESEEEEEHNSSLYWGERLEEDYYYMEGGEDDGELSWFNAGVRVGVGIGLGICLGLGVGAGLLLRSYKATTLNFKRRFS